MSDADSSSYGGEYKNLKQISRESKFFFLLLVWLLNLFRLFLLLIFLLLPVVSECYTVYAHGLILSSALLTSLCSSHIGSGFTEH